MSISAPDTTERSLKSIRPEKAPCWCDLPELDVLALAVDSKDVLYAGTAPDGKVYKIENGTAKEFFDPKAKYIWSLVFDKQGRLLVGTGDKGIIYRVTPDGKGTPFYDTDETHIISMAMDQRRQPHCRRRPERIRLSDFAAGQGVRSLRFRFARDSLRRRRAKRHDLCRSDDRRTLAESFNKHCCSGSIVPEASNLR